MYKQNSIHGYPNEEFLGKICLFPDLKFIRDNYGAQNINMMYLKNVLNVFSYLKV